MPNRSLTILIADDDTEDLELIEDAFTKVKPGTELDKVNNGKAVIEYLDGCADKDLPCLIILDYNMPEMNGSQVLSRICKESRYDSIPKVILSTSSTILHINECISSGATEYFVKPNNFRELESLARKILALCEEN